LPQVTAEETEYGLVEYGKRANGVVRVTCVLMPNNMYMKVPNEDPAETEWRDLLGWRVPIDDESHYGYMVDGLHVTDDAARTYRERAAAQREQLATLPSVAEVAQAVLRGDLRMQDVPDRPDAVAIQDYVAQIGQGAIADRTRERLGKSDVAVHVLRRL